MECAAAHRTERWCVRRSRRGYRQPGGRHRSRPFAGRASSSRDGIDAVPGCGRHRGPSRARGRRPDSRLRAPAPTAPAPACPRTHRTLPRLLRYLPGCPLHRRSSPATSATAHGASGRTAGTASTPGTATPESTRPPSRCARQPAAAHAALDRCRERSGRGRRNGSPARASRCRGGPRNGCPAPPSDCPGRARPRPQSSPAAGAKAEPERVLQSSNRALHPLSSFIPPPSCRPARRHFGGQSWTLNAPVPSTLRIELRVAHRPRRDSPCA